jgi:hypothetical protein
MLRSAKPRSIIPKRMEAGRVSFSVLRSSSAASGPGGSTTGSGAKGRWAWGGGTGSGSPGSGGRGDDVRLAGSMVVEGDHHLLRELDLEGGGEPADEAAVGLLQGAESSVVGVLLGGDGGPELRSDRRAQHRCEPKTRSFASPPAQPVIRVGRMTRVTTVAFGTP